MTTSVGYIARRMGSVQDKDLGFVLKSNLYVSWDCFWLTGVPSGNQAAPT